MYAFVQMHEDGVPVETVEDICFDFLKRGCEIPEKYTTHACEDYWAPMCRVASVMEREIDKRRMHQVRSFLSQVKRPHVAGKMQWTPCKVIQPSEWAVDHESTDRVVVCMPDVTSCNFASQLAITLQYCECHGIVDDYTVDLHKDVSRVVFTLHLLQHEWDRMHAWQLLMRCYEDYPSDNGDQVRHIIDSVMRHDDPFVVSMLLAAWTTMLLRRPHVFSKYRHIHRQLAALCTDKQCAYAQFVSTLNPTLISTEVVGYTQQQLRMMLVQTNMQCSTLTGQIGASLIRMWRFPTLSMGVYHTPICAVTPTGRYEQNIKVLQSLDDDPTGDKFGCLMDPSRCPAVPPTWKPLARVISMCCMYPDRDISDPSEWAARLRSKRTCFCRLSDQLQRHDI